MPLHQNSPTYPSAGSPSPVYRQSPTLEAGGYNSPEVASQSEGLRVATGYGHPSPAPIPGHATASSSVGNSGTVKHWPVPTSLAETPVPSLHVFKPYNGQHTQPKAPVYSFPPQQGKFSMYQ